MSNFGYFYKISQLLNNAILEGLFSIFTAFFKEIRAKILKYGQKLEIKTCPRGFKTFSRLLARNKHQKKMETLIF